MAPRVLPVGECSLPSLGLWSDVRSKMRRSFRRVARLLRPSISILAPIRCTRPSGERTTSITFRLLVEPLTVPASSDLTTENGQR